jgi:mRNA interferase RelE/StbE
VAVYSIRIKASAARELEATGSKTDRLRIVKRISGLATAPRPSGCEKLAGASNAWRVRQGDYRILFTVDDDARRIEIIKIGHRREVYRSS